MEENARLSSQVLSLESHVDEIQEQDKAKSDEEIPKLTMAVSNYTRRIEDLESEIKSLLYVNSRLSGELQSKQEWIKVLLEHLRIKKIELSRYKTYCVDLKVEFDHELDRLATRIQGLVDAKEAGRHCDLPLVYRSPLRNSVDQGVVESPIFDVLRKSILLGQSIDKSRHWPGSRLLALADSAGGVISGVSMSSRAFFGESIDLSENLRESVNDQVAMASTMRRSMQRSNTIKKVRGGASLQKFEPDSSEVKQDSGEKPEHQNINEFELS